MCLCDCEIDVTTDVRVMVMGLLVDDARVVQVPSFSGKDAGGEPREGDGERRGGAAAGSIDYL